jgi:hypothetical protein
VSNDAEAEALLHSLRGRYRIEALVEQVAVGRMATVRLSLPGEADVPVVDLLFASSGIEPEVVAAAEPLELLRGLVIPVAQTGHLLALKVLARDDISRPQDIADLRALMLVASPEELDRARQALALIAARGFHRGRSLVAEFETLLTG